MRPEQVPARPECPEPARWMAPDSDATETDVSALIGAFVTALKPDYVVETGAYFGDTTAVIGLALKGLRRGHLLSVEQDPAMAKRTQLRVDGLPVTVMVSPAAAVTPTQPIDMLFIDCDLSGRLDQLRAFQPYASPRCVILMHDSALPFESPRVPELYAVMEQSVADGLVQPWMKMPTPRGLAITRYQ